jgi:hypothetical protein
MEFNITITTKDSFEAANQWRNHTFRKHKTYRILLITAYVLIGMIYFVPFIVGLIILDEQDTGIFVATYSFAMILLGILILVVTAKLNNFTQNRSKLLTTEVNKYTINDDKIRSETECRIEETTIRGLALFLENEQRYILGGSKSLYIFPKKEIEKLANKDEFYKWIAIMNKKLNSTPTGGAKTISRNNRISQLCRKMFLEESRDRSKDDTTNNNKDEDHTN